MKTKIFSYENQDIEVTWDLKKCIHAKACVHGLPNVFDPNKKPWVDLDQEPDTSNIIETIESCPTGALQYSLKNNDAEEVPPAQNTLVIDENGPVFAHGNLVVQDVDGNELARETRLAFCRCGASSNKPLCDNSHLDENFIADSSYDPERLALEPQKVAGGELLIKLIENGPFVVEGNYILKGSLNDTKTAKRMSFCRCGASQNKPFCDGTHRKVGFSSND